MRERQGHLFFQSSSPVVSLPLCLHVSACAREASSSLPLSLWQSILSVSYWKQQQQQRLLSLLLYPPPASFVSGSCRLSQREEEREKR